MLPKQLSFPAQNTDEDTQHPFPTQPWILRRTKEDPRGRVSCLLSRPSGRMQRSRVAALLRQPLAISRQPPAQGDSFHPWAGCLHVFRSLLYAQGQLCSPAGPRSFGSGRGRPQLGAIPLRAASATRVPREGPSMEESQEPMFHGDGSTRGTQIFLTAPREPAFPSTGRQNPAVTPFSVRRRKDGLSGGVRGAPRALWPERRATGEGCHVGAVQRSPHSGHHPAT